MKEIYEKPIAKVEEFKNINVITTSGGDLGKDDNVVDGSDGWD